jgi:hypothetical protein
MLPIPLAARHVCARRQAIALTKHTPDNLLRRGVRINISGNHPTKPMSQSARIERPMLNVLQEPVRYQVPYPCIDSGSSPLLYLNVAASTKSIHRVLHSVDTHTLKSSRLEHRRPPVIGVIRVQPEHCLNLSHGSVGPFVIRFVHKKQIGNFHHAGLQRLNPIARARHRYHHGHVGGP